MAINLPNARNVFLPDVPTDIKEVGDVTKYLGDLKTNLELLFSKNFDNTDTVRNNTGVGTEFSSLTTIPTAAGVIPAANLTSVAQKGANSDITSLAGLTTALSVAQGGTGETASPLPAAKGGTGATAAANAASGVVVLNASSQLPAVSGALLTNLPAQAPTAVNDTDAGTNFGEEAEVTFLSVAKTITSGKTVLLIATGTVVGGAGFVGTSTITLKQGSTAVQTLSTIETTASTPNSTWACSGIVTGLSGSITFSVTAQASAHAINANTAYGNLAVIEF